jgi:cell division protease FtsH
MSLIIILLCGTFVNGFIHNIFHNNNINIYKNHKRLTLFNKENINKKYPLNGYYEKYLKKLNSKNDTVKEGAILGLSPIQKENMTMFAPSPPRQQIIISTSNTSASGIQIIINGGNGFGFNPDDLDDDDEDEEGFLGPYEEEEETEETDDRFNFSKKKEDMNKKSDNFEVMTKFDLNFTHIGGYDEVKSELRQIIDLMKNSSKYAKYNVRVPKGLIFEGSPGNGKTYIAKALAGEAKTGFIAVSGSEFQDKYVGVGPSRIRELFTLAKKNKPCIIFIDEIDALGRKRSSDGELSSSERDSTLNELLIGLDGFKTLNGVFLIGATNRIDLLDNALLRPGRIDKKIHIGEPDKKTREKVINIHIKGKPFDSSVTLKDINEETTGYSCAQIENLLNEAMLNALRENRNKFSSKDIELVTNKMMVGWQPIEHEFNSNIIDHIAVHEMGHAIVGMISKHHSNVSKVIINLNSPKSPGYTVFETSVNNIHTREELTEHLMILLGGRIAEEIIYGKSVTTGALSDFDEAYKLAEKMIYSYGMGKTVIYPFRSEKYKEQIDEEINNLLQQSYINSEKILKKYKNELLQGANILKCKKVLKQNDLIELIDCNESHIIDYINYIGYGYGN